MKNSIERTALVFSNYFAHFPSLIFYIPIFFLILYKLIFLGDQHYNADASPIVLLAGIGDLKDQQSERLLISKMLTNHTVDFLWNTGSEWPGWPAQDNKTTIFNRYYRAGFTSKVSQVTLVNFF